MTKFESPIALGDKYVNQRTGVTGHAVWVGFNENGCVDVGIECVHTDSSGKIDVEIKSINELLLTLPDGSPLQTTKQTYETDVVLGRHYRDKQTGLEGWACVVDFHENMATRVTIKSIGYDKDGAKVLKYHGIDDFLLIDIETQVVAERKTEKRSPITREVAAR